ncbi:hypothetical protein ACRRTK_006180 [Alexandromys fortis]
MFYYPPTPKFSPLPVPFPDTESGFGSLLGGRATGKRECLVLGSLDSGAWSSRCVPHLSLEEVLPIHEEGLLRVKFTCQYFVVFGFLKGTFFFFSKR